VARERAAELRVIAAAKAEAHRRGRAGGAADVVVVREGEGAAARGLTEDYLDVALGAGAPPRAARFRATLLERGGELRAEALGPVSG